MVPVVDEVVVDELSVIVVMLVVVGLRSTPVVKNSPRCPRWEQPTGPTTRSGSLLAPCVLLPKPAMQLHTSKAMTWWRSP